MGGAFLGLTLLEREKKIYLESPGVQPDLESQAFIVGRLLKPEAQKEVIEFLAEQEIHPTSMMDISDGLSSEILHICKQSECGAVIYEDKLPVHADARLFAFQLDLDPTTCALNGGEDYELLFTIKQADYDKIVLSENISVIGYITEADNKVTLQTKGGNSHPIIAQGWQHEA